MIQYDYSKLLGRMREKGFTQAVLAKSLGINAATLNRKLKNCTDFNQTEMRKIAQILDINSIEEYFFCILT